MQIDAVLEEFTLLELIHTAVNYQKTGVFKYETAAGDIAEIYLEHGNIVHAKSGQIEGEDLLVDLFFRDHGRLSFKADVTTNARTIYSDSLELIITYAERVDDARKIERELPEVDTILVRSPRPEKGMAQIDITLDQWQVLSLANGYRSIRDIIHDSGKGDALIKEMLVYLIEHGLLVNPKAIKNELQQVIDHLNMLLQACRVQIVHGALWDDLIRHTLEKAPENLTAQHVVFENDLLALRRDAVLICNKQDVESFYKSVKNALLVQGIREYGQALMRHKLAVLGMD